MNALVFSASLGLVAAMLESDAPERMRACAVNNTVLLASVSDDFAPVLVEAARAAARVGFPCVAVAVQNASASAALVRERAVVQLLPRAPRAAPLPSAAFCSARRARLGGGAALAVGHLYGWRRTQLFKPALLAAALALGLNALLMDADWRVARSPLADIARAASPRGAAAADVIAHPDDAYVNFGRAWVRATDRARARLAWQARCPRQQLARGFEDRQRYKSLSPSLLTWKN